MKLGQGAWEEARWSLVSCRARARGSEAVTKSSHDAIRGAVLERSLKAARSKYIGRRTCTRHKH